MSSEPSKPPFRPYKKHILVCTGPRCAPETSPSVYQWLKDKLKELKLHEGAARIQRSQCHCFGICQAGPLAVVYPEGIWYHGLTQDKMERVLNEHLIGGKVVHEYVLHEDKIGQDKSNSMSSNF